MTDKERKKFGFAGAIRNAFPHHVLGLEYKDDELIEITLRAQSPNKNDWITKIQFHFDHDKIWDAIKAAIDAIDDFIECSKSISWNPNDFQRTRHSGNLYVALHRVGDDSIKSSIQDQMNATFDKETLDKIAVIFAYNALSEMRTD